MKNNKGITLVALVVTIVVLLILSGVSINLVLGNNGIIAKAKDAETKSAEAGQNDLKGMNVLVSEMEGALAGNGSTGSGSGNGGAGGSGAGTKVPAEANVSGLSEDVVTKSELVLYDSDNNVIDQSLLANNLVTEGVSVSVQVLETKSVKVEFDTSQITAADGYSVSDIKYEPDHVNVTGRAEELKKLKKISVPASALNMSGLTSKTEKVVDITDYLPEDISLTDENAGSVVVTVGIDKDGTKSYDISMGAIKVNNLASGLSLSYESADVLEIQIRGPEDILDQYKISDNVSIDLKNYQTAGTYTVPVTVGVPDGCVLESTVSVNVILEEK